MQSIDEAAFALKVIASMLAAILLVMLGGAMFIAPALLQRLDALIQVLRDLASRA